MNSCFFTGRTTKEFELRYANELAIGTCSIAVDDGYGDKKHTSFFNITAFGKTAESMNKYIPKGTKIAVECRARQEEYTDKAGQKRYSINFIVDSWEFAQSKGESAQIGSPEATTESSVGDGFMSLPDDELADLLFN